MRYGTSIYLKCCTLHAIEACDKLLAIKDISLCGEVIKNPEINLPAITLFGLLLDLTPILLNVWDILPKFYMSVLSSSSEPSYVYVLPRPSPPLWEVVA